MTTRQNPLAHRDTTPLQTLSCIVRIKTLELEYDIFGALTRMHMERGRGQFPESNKRAGGCFTTALAFDGEVRVRITLGCHERLAGPGLGCVNALTPALERHVCDSKFSFWAR